MTSLKSDSTMVPAEEIPDPEPTVKSKPKGGWKEDDVLILPKNRIGIVFSGLAGVLALAAIDQTIVATALPTMILHLGGGNLYSWVGTGYMLGGAALMPLQGKLSDILGRKPMLFTSITLFMVGSALCGAAQNMVWLVICRVIQGMGSGGILSLVSIIVADIVPYEDRNKYGGMMGAVWGISCVIGPLLGGVFSERVSWRWIFWFNLPVGGFATAVLVFFLNLNPPKPTSFREEVKAFDFMGLLLLVIGVVCILIGFNYSETSWSSAQTIALVAIGIICFIVAGLYETFVAKYPIVPPRLFKTRTTAIILITSILHAMILMGVTFYLPLYYQVFGASAIGAGVRMIPFSFGNAFISIVGGAVVTKMGTYRPVIWICWGTLLLGVALMTMLSDTSNNAEMEIFPMFVGMGLGPLFLVPLIALQAAMPLKYLATATAAFTLIRQISASISIAIVQTIITTSLKPKINAIPNANFDTSPAALMQAALTLKYISNPTVRVAIIHAYTLSIRNAWIVMAPMAGISLIMVLFIKAYSLKGNVVHSGEEKVPLTELVVDKQEVTPETSSV